MCVAHPHKPSRCAAGQDPHGSHRCSSAYTQADGRGQHCLAHSRRQRSVSTDSRIFEFQAVRHLPRKRHMWTNGSRECWRTAAVDKSLSPPAERSGLVQITEIESARELDSSHADAGYASARSLTQHAEAELARKASADLGTAPASGHDYVPRVLHIHILQ